MLSMAAYKAAGKCFSEGCAERGMCFFCGGRGSQDDPKICSKKYGCKAMARKRKRRFKPPGNNWNAS